MAQRLRGKALSFFFFLFFFFSKRKKEVRKIPRLDYWSLSPAPTAQHILPPVFQTQSCTMLQLSSPDSLPTREILRVRLTLGQGDKKRSGAKVMTIWLKFSGDFKRLPKVFVSCMKIPTSATCEYKKHQRLRGTLSISHLPDVLWSSRLFPEAFPLEYKSKQLKITNTISLNGHTN